MSAAAVQESVTVPAVPEQVGVARLLTSAGCPVRCRLVRCFSGGLGGLLVVAVLAEHGEHGFRVRVVEPCHGALFASWAWGFTINRVSLFALIFAIGILVDDA